MTDFIFIGFKILGHGGIERFNRNFIRHLAQLSEKTLAISLLDRTDRSGPVPISGCKGRKVIFVWNVLWALTTGQTLFLGHIHLLKILYYLHRFVNFNKIYLIIHGIDAWSVSNPHILKLLPKLTYIISVSEFTFNRFRLHVPAIQQFIHIPNELDNGFSIISAEKSIEKWVEPEGLQLISITRLAKSENHYKGIKDVFQLLTDLKRAQIRFSYVLVAHGDHVDEYRQLSRDLELDSQIIWKSGLSDKEIQDLLQTSHFFLLPSLGEGFGIVYLEAMANGAICIGAESGGVPEVISNGKDGFLVNPAEDTNPVADQMFSIIQLVRQNPDLQYSLLENASQKVSQFTFSGLHPRYVLNFKPDENRG